MSSFSRIPTIVREIRVHMCQTSPASQGVRRFVLSQYEGIKSQRPDLKFMIREARNAEPRMFVRFDGGVEESVSLSNMSESEVSQRLQAMVATGETGETEES